MKCTRNKLRITISDVFLMVNTWIKELEPNKSGLDFVAGTECSENNGLNNGVAMYRPRNLIHTQTRSDRNHL